MPQRSQRARKKKITCIFNLNSERIIIDYMERWASHGRQNRNPFVELICLVSNEPFSNEEKGYIYSWVEDYLSSNKKTIPWKTLQSKMEEEFRRFRSRNDIKNIWYSRERRLARQAANILDPLLFGMDQPLQESN
ncbi:3485_t:CDS:2 [Rhizophagus irregularis]|nr:3485_t:CDS:2 [Rhizophagus irregularis]